MIATLGSFILSRASLALFGADRLSAGQKWLLYPGLLAVYLPVAALLFIGPVAIVGLSAIKNENDFKAASQREPTTKHVQREAALRKSEKPSLDTKMWNVSLNPIKVACGLTAVAGASWFLIGLLWALLPGLVRIVFYPLVSRSSRRPGFAIAVIGLLMSLGGVLFLR
jgi:hypothetical protein